jgi:SAM-dependent methyltransferase
VTHGRLKTGAQTYSSAIETATNYTRWIVSRCEPYLGESILEVGLGHGGYRAFLPKSARYVGLDIDEASVRRASERHPQDRFVVADVTDPAIGATLREHHLDTVLCVNVLEHIPDDGRAVANLMGALERGGHLVVLSPAFQLLYSNLDHLAGHVRRYRKADVARLLPPAAELVRCEYFNAIGGVGWLVNKLISHQDLNSPAVNSQIVLFDRLVVPFARVADVVFRPVFGQSILFVMRKG